MLADFLLLILNVGGYVLFFGRVMRKNEIDTAILFCEEESLIKFLLQPFKVNIKVLWHDHVLIIPQKCLTSLILALLLAFDEIYEEIIFKTFNHKFGGFIFFSWVI